MFVAALLTGAALQAAVPPPPLPPLAPLAPPPVAAAPLPPLPPLPGDGMEVMRFNENGQHITIIKHRGPGEGHGPGGHMMMSPGSMSPGPMSPAKDEHVLRFKDTDGRDVTVIADHALTQAEAEKMAHDASARIPQIRKDALDHAKTARTDAEVYRRDALRYAADARRDGDMARKEGEKAREYAQVIIKQMKDKDGHWKEGAGMDFGPHELDGPGGPHVFVRRFEGADGGDLRALRDEVHALRDEVRALKEQLRSGPVR